MNSNNFFKVFFIESPIYSMKDFQAGMVVFVIEANLDLAAIKLTVIPFFFRKQSHKHLHHNLEDKHQ